MGRKKKPQAVLKVPEPPASEPIVLNEDLPVLPVPRPATRRVDCQHGFEVFIMAGMSQRDHARREQEEIEREQRRRGIANIRRTEIVRHGIPGPGGRKKSTVIVFYQKEEIVKE